MNDNVNHYVMGRWTNNWHQVKLFTKVLFKRLDTTKNETQHEFGDSCGNFFGIGEIESRKLGFRWATNQVPNGKKITDGQWHHHTKLLDDSTRLRKLKKGTLGREYIRFMDLWTKTMQSLGKEWIPQETMHNRGAQNQRVEERTSFLKKGKLEDTNTKAFVNPAVLNYYMTSEDVHPDLKKDIKELGMMKAVRVRISNRMFGLHDTHHIILGVGRDQLGEMLIQVKYAVDAGLTGFRFVTFLEAIRECFINLSLKPLKIRSEGFRIAKESGNMLTQDYSKLLTKSVEQIRKDLNIKKNVSYQNFLGVTEAIDFPTGRYKKNEYGI